MASDFGPLWAIVEGEAEGQKNAGSGAQENRGATEWWWGGDEVGARRRFRERFGREAEVMRMPFPGVVALGPV